MDEDGPPQDMGEVLTKSASDMSYSKMKVGYFPRVSRNVFLRKVFGILSFQMFTASIFASFMVLDRYVRQYVLEHKDVMGASALLAVLAMCTAMQCMQRKYPVNLYLMMVWTGVMSFALGTACAANAPTGEGFAVLESVFLALAVVSGLTAFTLQEKLDFSFVGGVVGSILWVTIAWALVNTLFGWRHFAVYTLMAAQMISLYIIVDTYIMTEKLGTDDFIEASIKVYIDPINLIMHAIQSLTKRASKEK
mmetsp:Transcript_17638/g.25752  ORF Transcript_17638/g.25752 Transcript_17638/m.25752 type:complete len:250 (-) Transcript_17638:69-818(-)|eukprot:CAMPEP_0113943980 /NCGR_PEP_ID=MMETSP1339-20121228/30161_1 /TAXON_ID=94617 /ORGANISM="Fibrocapsa japonica" /LENGTH=249 /DNA_ID=CAMNT_0000949005 /DNA_START=57 /DNA_END=806 /DNA_ORIENTATION=+ /assembly_acc=CAM_ASM_000762